MAGMFTNTPVIRVSDGKLGKLIGPDDQNAYVFTPDDGSAPGYLHPQIWWDTVLTKGTAFRAAPPSAPIEPVVQPVYTPDPRGLVKKYIVVRVNPDDSWGDVVEGPTFTLRPFDPHARKALLAYAESVNSENAELANDLKNLVERFTPAKPELGLVQASAETVASNSDAKRWQDLTKEEVLAMPAGRALDAFIADATNGPERFYSTDIAAAYDLMQWSTAGFASVSVFGNSAVQCGGWDAWYGLVPNSDPEVCFAEAKGETLPLAVARASLLLALDGVKSADIQPTVSPLATTPKESEESRRDQFEKWALSVGWNDIKDADGLYVDHIVKLLWEAWNAALDSQTVGDKAEKALGSCETGQHDWERIPKSDQAERCKRCGLVSGK